MNVTNKCLLVIILISLGEGFEQNSFLGYFKLLVCCELVYIFHLLHDIVFCYLDKGVMLTNYSFCYLQVFASRVLWAQQDTSHIIEGEGFSELHISLWFIQWRSNAFPSLWVLLSFSFSFFNISWISFWSLNWLIVSLIWTSRGAQNIRLTCQPTRSRSLS